MPELLHEHEISAPENGVDDWSFDDALKAYEETLDSCKQTLEETAAREREYKKALTEYERALEESKLREQKYKQALSAYEQALKENTERERNYKRALDEQKAESLEWTRGVLHDADIHQIISSLNLVQERLQQRIVRGSPGEGIPTGPIS